MHVIPWERCVLLHLSLLLLGHSGAMEGPRPAPPPDDALIRKVEERVEMLRKWRILEALDPSEDVATRLLPLLSSADRRERELEHQRERLTEQLRVTLRTDGRNEARLEEILTALTATARQRCSAQEELDHQLSALLSVYQRARLVVALQEFHREVRELIDRVRRPPPGPAGSRITE
ncbi:hypothetical protein JXA88_08380 [Candidatus Fermentibacteria bacterium]|nr:hypothetical protein [Candidatus Fermentibacteria bacterium]